MKGKRLNELLDGFWILNHSSSRIVSENFSRIGCLQRSEVEFAELTAEGAIGAGLYQDITISRKLPTIGCVIHYYITRDGLRY